MSDAQESHDHHTTSGQTLRRIAQAADTANLPRYIAVEGPIGAGKTTLATRLAETLRYPALLEPVTDNPFLDRFYTDAGKHALPTQLFFLLHRARQVSDIARDDLVGPNLVSDFLIEKDQLFAKLNLDAQEYTLYQQIHASLHINPPAPELVIYLQAPAEILRQRVMQRGLPFEQSIELEYLANLADAYTEFFHYYDAAPVLIVNAAEIDFGNQDSHFDLLIKQILRMDGTRQFFNPNPSLL